MFIILVVAVLIAVTYVVNIFFDILEGVTRFLDKIPFWVSPILIIVLLGVIAKDEHSKKTYKSKKGKKKKT